MSGRLLAVSTNPAIDRVALIAAPPAPGEPVRAREFLETPGGKAVHVALVAARLGADVHLVAPAGGRRGALLAELLDAQGIPTTLVPMAAETRGTYTIVDATGAPPLEVHEPAPELTADEADALVRASVGALAGSAVAVIAGSLPAGAPASLHARLTREARAAGVFVALDTSDREAFRIALAEHPDLVKPNAAEARALGGGEQLQRRLRADGARMVWLTRGAAGSIFAGDAGEWELSAEPAGPVVNPVGCGDALLGGFAAGWLRGLEPLDAAAFGVAAATDKLRHLHPGEVDAARVEALASEVVRRAV